ncbi:hypothetical protein NDU88_007546, partial [Pleurodeles waltl]
RGHNPAGGQVTTAELESEVSSPAAVTIVAVGVVHWRFGFSQTANVIIWRKAPPVCWQHFPPY